MMIGIFPDNRWLSTGLVWESDQKGFFINFLTFTFDIGYGKFGEDEKTFSFKLGRMKKYLFNNLTPCVCNSSCSCCCLCQDDE